MQIMEILHSCHGLASRLLNKDLLAAVPLTRIKHKTQTEIINTMLRKLNIKSGGFTLVEIMIVVAIIALLAAIAVPNFLRSRKRSQATQVLEDLRILDSAVDQYAIENNKSGGTSVSWADAQKYIKAGTRLYNSGGNDILGNSFSAPFTVDTTPKVPSATYTALSDVAPNDFWSPYK
jgi:prepilin-type N-terminal cleavage/methylation domain-containing protein